MFRKDNLKNKNKENLLFKLSVHCNQRDTRSVRIGSNPVLCKVKGSINQNLPIDWIEIDSQSNNTDGEYNQDCIKSNIKETPKYLFVQNVQNEQFMAKVEELGKSIGISQVNIFFNNQTSLVLFYIKIINIDKIFSTNFLVLLLKCNRLIKLQKKWYLKRSEKIKRNMFSYLLGDMQTSG